jgi:hypothetical protein
MFLSSRAQVNSPFELLVAIIIMGFVIIIGSQMISATNDQVCLANVEKAMAEFVIKLEDTASFRTSNKIDFRPVTNNCYTESKAIMKIDVIRDDARLCSAACGRAVNSCFIMTFQSPEIANGFKRKCLNLPIYTSFVEGTTDCPTTETALQSYDPITPTGGNIVSGSYILRNVAPAGQTYPKICTYFRR